MSAATSRIMARNSVAPATDKPVSTRHASPPFTSKTPTPPLIIEPVAKMRGRLVRGYLWTM